MEKQKNRALTFCLIALLSYIPHLSADTKEMDQFYYAVEKSNNKKALEMLNKNGALVNAKDQFDFNSPLENALNNFNQTDIKKIKANPDQTQLLERLFYHNLYQNKLNPLKGASLEDSKKSINLAVKDKKKKKIATDLLSWAHNLVSKQNIIPEEITNQLFFEEIMGASPKALRLIQTNPFWLEEKSSNGLNALQVAMKNYSGRTEEDELITMIITLKPELLFPENNKDEAIQHIISRHISYVGRLSNIVFNAIKKVKKFPAEGGKSSQETKEFYLNNYGVSTKKNSSLSSKNNQKKKD